MMIKAFGLISLVSLFTTLAPVHAAETAFPQSGLEHLGTRVGDEELADMRGKFAVGGDIAYFGLTMQSMWTDAEGITTAATFFLSLNFAEADSIGETIPLLMVGYERSGDPGLDIGGAAVGPAVDATVIDLSGALQSVAIAGSENQVLNHMEVAVVDGVPIHGPDAGLAPIEQTTGIGFADGDTLGFLLEPGAVGLLMTGQSGDALVQRFGSDSNQASQRVTLNTDGNTIFNGMNIVIGRDVAASSQVAASHAGLTSLRALSP